MKITLLTGRTFDFKEKFGFNIKVVKSAQAKRLTLRIDEKNHRPILTVPKYCSQTQALKFLEDNHDWMINMLARLPRSTDFSNGETISFFGQKYIILHTPLERRTYFDDGFLKVSGDSEFLHRRTMDFLKQSALKKLSEMTVKQAKILGCRVSSVAIKDTKSRWGSCSTLGNINYNWRICMAPIHVINYLVCHEVSHLKHPDHSTAFWSCVKDLCPDYEEGRHWLKVKGKDLYKYI